MVTVPSRQAAVAKEYSVGKHRFLFAAALFALLLVPSAPSATTSSGSPYSLSVQALLGGRHTDVYLRLASDTARLPDALAKVQLKAFSPEGEHVSTENVFDVPVNGGVAVLGRAGFARGDLLEVKAHAKVGSQNELVADTYVALRPDLKVELTAPARVVRKQTFDVTVSVDELNGDTGASAAVSVYDGLDLLATRHVEVGAGGHADVPFALKLSLPTCPETSANATWCRSHSLFATVSDVDPAEFDSTNDSDSAPIDVRVYDGDGVVVTEEAHATDVGAAILSAGGNAIDAAAAVEFALSVTRPHTTGIGGGSTLLVHLADGENYSIDAREKAPASAAPTMFVGRKPLNLRNQSGCAVGVPGTLAAVDLMLSRWGTMSLADTLRRPIQLAEDGFPVGFDLASATTEDRAAFQPETRAVFRLPNGDPLPVGYWLKQPDLAKTFRLLADQGPSALYDGQIAPAVIAAQTRTRASGCEGRMTLADLAAYTVKVSKPIFVGYRGYDVVSVPPSSSGGLVLLQALKLMQRFPLGDASLGYGPGAGKTLNVMIEATRLALADRDRWIGDDDPTFGYPVPVQCLLSDEYTALRSGLISDSARIPTVAPGDPCAPGPGAPVEFDQSDGAHTTHFSILDKWSNVVSFTTTLTDGFGTGITVPGYGFALNDSLVNFNLSPTENPATGDPGANDPGPNRRARGSTTPVLIFKGAEPLVATGAWGGAWIPSMVLQVVSNVIDQGMPIEQAVDAPRFWLNGPAAGIGVNAGFPDASIAYLRALGQPIGLPGGATFGATQSLGVDPVTFKLYGASDKRSRNGSAILLP
jgi:gamma-glutamyltranspeptidase/glutathione hydrolase